MNGFTAADALTNERRERARKNYAEFLERRELEKAAQAAAPAEVEDREPTREDRIKAARQEREAEVRRVVAPVAVPDRLRRLIANPEFSEAALRVPVRTDNRAANTSTDAQLLYFAHEGDAEATAILYAKYVNLIESKAIAYGALSRSAGARVVFDEDDAHQTGAEVLLRVIAEGPTRRDLAGRLAHEVHDVVRREAWDHCRVMTVDRSRVRRVLDAVDKFGGDLGRAADYLATTPSAHGKISRERFFAIYNAQNLGDAVDLDAGHGDEDAKPVEIEDAQASRVLSAVLGGGFDNEKLDAAWNMLPHRSQEVLTKSLGLDGEPQTDDAIAVVLGLSRSRVTNVRKEALTKLRAAMQ